MRRAGRNGPGRESAAAVRTALGGAAACLGVLLGLAAPALADKIITKTGDTFSGTIVEESPSKVVLKTQSGTINLPRDTIKTIEKAGAPAADPKAPAAPAAAPVQIVAAVVDPANAKQALADAKTALVAGDWVKAGGLLEGLMALDEKAFPAEDRLGATGALVNCYLQIKDAQGAARAMARRANLVTDANDKRRLLAAAEALRTVGSIQVGDKTVGRFEEAVEAGMAWKVEQCLTKAKDLAAKAQRLNEMAQLDSAARTSLARLEEADVYVPGYSAAHRKDVIAVLVTKIMEAGKNACDMCEKVRPELTRTRTISVTSVAAAAQWNARGKPYLETREIAEVALKNIRPFTTKYEAPELYTGNRSAIDRLLADLDDYQYYPKDTQVYSSFYGGYTTPNERVRIALRKF